jgi:hypothetical protein
MRPSNQFYSKLCKILQHLQTFLEFVNNSHSRPKRPVDPSTQRSVNSPAKTADGGPVAARESIVDAPAARRTMAAGRKTRMSATRLGETAPRTENRVRKTPVARLHPCGNSSIPSLQLHFHARRLVSHTHRSTGGSLLCALSMASLVVLHPCRPEPHPTTLFKNPGSLPLSATTRRSSRPPKCIVNNP